MYDSSIFYWSIIDRDTINSEGRDAFNKLLKWCNDSIKDESRWSIVTTTEERYLPTTKMYIVQIERYISFYFKDDFTLYKLTWK